MYQICRSMNAGFHFSHGGLIQRHRSGIQGKITLRNCFEQKRKLPSVIVRLCFLPEFDKSRLIIDISCMEHPINGYSQHEGHMYKPSIDKTDQEFFQKIKN